MKLVIDVGIEMNDEGKFRAFYVDSASDDRWQTVWMDTEEQAESEARGLIADLVKQAKGCLCIVAEMDVNQP